MSILALTSNTLAGSPGAGQIEYNGQFYATDSNSARGQLERITQGTAVASTSGTSIDFTGIPAWAKRITVMFNGVSTSGSSVIQIRLAGSSGYEATGYLGGIFCSGLAENATTGIAIGTSGESASTVRNGSVVITLLNSSTNVFSAQGGIGRSDTAQAYALGFSKAITGTLTAIRITTVNGTDTFDAGSINIMYEG